MTLPPTLEPIPDDSASDLELPREGMPRPKAERNSPANSGRSSPTTSPRGAPYRGPGAVFGRFMGPLSGESASGEPKSSITVEPHSDPAAEAAVKRRVERQIQQSLADKVKDLDVRVVGRSVVIRARATRFWQRRSLRRSLESMALPSGYRARVEILD